MLFTRAVGAKRHEYDKRAKTFAAIVCEHNSKKKKKTVFVIRVCGDVRLCAVQVLFIVNIYDDLNIILFIIKTTP